MRADYAPSVTEATVDRRRELLDAAAVVFAQKGFHASRVGDIAEEAGVAHGLLYHYFRSKEEVLETIFRETWGALVVETQRIEEADVPLREQLRRFAGIYLGSWLITPDAIRVLVREIGRSPDVGERVDEIRGVFRRPGADDRGGEGARRGARGLRSGARGVGRLRLARGDPDRLGARPAAGREARRRSCGVDGGRCRACGAGGVTKIVNLLDAATSRRRTTARRDIGFARAPLGREPALSLTGFGVYELEPGEATWPYHFELNEEEWLIVVAGEVTLRTPDGERVLRVGDVACFPAGAAGAHAMRNAGASTARFAMPSQRARRR